MVTSLNNLSKETSSGSAGQPRLDETTLAELRKSLNGIAAEFAEIAEKRARQVKETADVGVSAVRSGIRRQPAVAMALAALAGAVLAVLLVPSRRTASPSRWARARWDAWAPGWMPSMPSLTRADLYDALDSVQRSVARGTAPLAGSFERLLEAIAKVDPGASLDSTLDKAGSWLERMQSRLRK